MRENDVLLVVVEMMPKHATRMVKRLIVFKFSVLTSDMCKPNPREMMYVLIETAIVRDSWRAGKQWRSRIGIALRLTHDMIRKWSSHHKPLQRHSLQYTRRNNMTPAAAVKPQPTPLRRAPPTLPIAAR